MKVAVIGLGKMGYPLALNLKDQGYTPLAYNRTVERVHAIQKEGVAGFETISSLMAAFEERRICWLMVPAGEPVDEMIGQLLPHLRAEDIVIDGGNSHFQDTRRRCQQLREQGVHYVDVGTSGGVEGARSGACMMVGGDREVVAFLEPVFRSLCVKDGYAHVGESGAGHYVKMIHNGIEYGMMQSIAEGFELMAAGEYALDYAQVAQVWRHGSVIRSWLMDLTENVFREHENLEDIRGVVGSSGEGLWTVEEALQKQIPLPAITAALYTRYRSGQEDTFSAKLLAGLRFQFGGHQMEKNE